MSSVLPVSVVVLLSVGTIVAAPALTTLYSFTGGTDGNLPLAGLAARDWPICLHVAKGAALAYTPEQLQVLVSICALPFGPVKELTSVTFANSLTV